MIRPSGSPSAARAPFATALRGPEVLEVDAPAHQQHALAPRPEVDHRIDQRLRVGHRQGRAVERHAVGGSLEPVRAQDVRAPGHRDERLGPCERGEAGEAAQPVGVDDVGLQLAQEPADPADVGGGSARAPAHLLRRDEGRHATRPAGRSGGGSAGRRRRPPPRTRGPASRGRDAPRGGGSGSRASAAACAHPGRPPPRPWTSLSPSADRRRRRRMRPQRRPARVRRMEGTTLITGGAGYIGMLVAEELLAASHDVRVLDSLLHDQQGCADDAARAGRRPARRRCARRRRARRRAARRRRGRAPRRDRRRPGVRARRADRSGRQRRRRAWP